jgi:hypothetical protein
MNKIINLDDHRPHEAQYVVCMKCAHDWVAVFPHAAKNLECSECGEMSGEVVNYKDFGWFNNFMGRAKNKKDQMKRTMVLLNAKRMGL